MPASPDDREAEADALSAAVDAILYANIDTDGVRFPLRTMDRLVGPMLPNKLLFVQAATGQGKTTFLLDIAERWAAGNCGVEYFGTEQEPAELWLKLACRHAHVPTEIALNANYGEYRDGFGDGDEARQRIFHAYATLKRELNETGRLHFSPDRFLTMATLLAGIRDAVDCGRRVIILDHIDRVELSLDQHPYLAMKALVRRLKEWARDYGLIIIAATQSNREARRGDRLSVYLPPQLHHMEMGASKEHEADVVLGVYRPLRALNPDESPKDFAASMARVRNGEADPKTVLKPWTMGIAVTKHRTNGRQEGSRAELELTPHGQLLDIEPNFSGHLRA